MRRRRGDATAAAGSTPFRLPRRIHSLKTSLRDLFSDHARVGGQVPSHASSRIQKVLVANRGEIAVRVIRAARDAGLPSVAVYAEPDADAPHVRLADEAFALGAQTSAESYLVFEKILDAAAQSGANAIHPGYGFLSENADFAQAVIDAGLIWIGPSPQSIRDLGDKVTARHIAARAKAPLVPGTPDPVANADEVVAFAERKSTHLATSAAARRDGSVWLESNK